MYKVRILSEYSGNNSFIVTVSWRNTFVDPLSQGNAVDFVQYVMAVTSVKPVDINIKKH